jgi:hypothetical protein
MGSLLGPIEIGSRRVLCGRVVWPAGGRPTTALHAILCDNVDEKLIEFVEIVNDAQTLELISILSRTRGRAGCCGPRNAVSCATDL